MNAAGVFNPAVLAGALESLLGDLHGAAVVALVHPRVRAAHNGAGAGIAKALMDSGRANKTVFVGHDVTVVTRKLLLNGVMDAPISQNPGHEARAAVRVLLALARGEPILSEQEKIRIDIVMRDNLP